MRLPSTLDEGTHKSQPLLESTTTPPKDSRGNIQPLDMDLTSTNSDEGMAKTTLHLKGSLGDKDSGGNISTADMEPIHPIVADLSRTGAKYQVDQTQSTRLSDNILMKYDNILPLTERQLVKYFRKIYNALFAKINKDNWESMERPRLIKLTSKHPLMTNMMKTLLIEIRLTKKLMKDVEEERLLAISKPEDKKNPCELRIKSALPAPAPEQALSKSSRKKRKHMELKPEVKFLDWNSDIDKGRMKLLCHLVAASMVKSPENTRFIMKLKKLIAEHPNQEKLKLKKVKLEALRYEMN
nr:hypothetical protein [Tanacetum cinerariifolium]